MAQVMKSQRIAVHLCQLFEVLPDDLIVDRHDEVLITFMRHGFNQLEQIFRQYQLTGRGEGLVDVPHNILAAEIEFAASDCQHAVFQVLKLQAAHLADAQAQPQCQHTRQLDICPAYHLYDLGGGREILDLRLFRRQCDVEFNAYAIEFQCCNEQIFRFRNRLPSDGQSVLIDRFLQIEAGKFMDVGIHD